MARFCLWLIVFLLCPWLSLEATSSDSINVLAYQIHIDTIVNTSVKRIHAHTRVQLTPTVSNLNVITLDLLELTIDSIQVEGQSAAFTYNDTLIAISTPQAYSPVDTVMVEVWYQGRPQQDPGFGGFYFQGPYVFSIGVSLAADPHNYGRVWFPCKDNFRDRALFDFHIRHDTALTAVCNGTLQMLTLHGDGTQTAHWKLKDAIPTYLAGMALAPYAVVQDTFVSITGDTLPLQLYALPGDTNNAKSQSANLKAGIAAFEQRFGPYRWERVGYVMVELPLTGSIGAMEHATNIAFPRVVLPLGQQYETIWAHEISHGWFGNLATCEDAAEMWLNEGWATYCENIFTEALYGPGAYKNAVRDKHSDVLRRAHHEDGGYQALSAMPTAYTYGRTVYVKGAGVAHTLRSQVGDSAFFAGIRNYLNANAWSDVSSDSLRISLEAASGQNLQDFFDGWVHQPGFPHFRVDSFASLPNGPNWDVTVHFSQRLRGALSYAQNTRMTLRFLSQNSNSEDRAFTFSGQTHTETFSLPWNPVVVALDPEEGLTDATTDRYLPVTQIGALSFPHTWAVLNVTTWQQNDWIRVVHHWVGADSLRTPVPGLKLSDSRYWSLEGLFLPGLDLDMTLTYNGTQNASNGLLDHTWLTNSEDSMRVLYRPDRATDWTIWQNTTWNTGNVNNKFGSVIVRNALPGDYTLGIFDSPVGLAENPQVLDFTLHPNPSEGIFEVGLPAGLEGVEITLLDMKGALVRQLKTVPGTRSTRMDMTGLADGVYHVLVREFGGRSAVKKLIIAN